MVDVFRGMLDELMGKERDVPLDKRSGRGLRFDDPDVCKHQLAGLCPFQLFKNTKSDLGKCDFTIHDDHLEWANVQAEYDELNQREKDRLRYEDELFKLLDRLIRDMDRKIEKAKERAENESRPKVLRPEDQKRLDEIQDRIKECQARAEKLGEEGDVDNALAMTNSADNYKRQYEMLHKTLTQPERTMTVCDICGVFINSTDNEQRRLTPGELRAREDHLQGKQYLGWKKIRDTYAEMKQKRAAGPGRDPDRDRDRDHYGRSSSRDYGRSSSRDYERREHRSHHERERGGYYERERGGGGGYDRGYDRGGYDRGAYRRERERSPRRGGGSSRDYDRDHRRGGSEDYDYGR